MNVFETGVLYFNGKKEIRDDNGWKKHPSFQGVYLKDIIAGMRRDAKMSLHLVKIEPGCAINWHTHDDKAELHLVLEGNGLCSFEGEEMDYQQGNSGYIPSGTAHKVSAGDAGLLIAAVFV